LLKSMQIKSGGFCGPKRPTTILIKLEYLFSCYLVEDDYDVRITNILVLAKV